MTRFHFAAILADLLLGLTLTAAPVPKAAPVKSLTPEMVVGTWGYLWGSWEGGIICFGKDGTYSAQHVPGGDTSYHGTWTICDGDTVVIQECSYCFATGEFRGGPTEYRFKFDLKGYPTLKGLSNESTPVCLSNPKR